MLFILGAVSGYFVELKVDDFKNAKIERFEQILEMDAQEDYYFHEDPAGRIWAMQEGHCVQVF